jgi:hypothetical protein
LIALCLQRNSGCPFFYWEHEYEEYLKDLSRQGLLATLLATDGEQSAGVCNVEAVAPGMMDFGLVAPKEEPTVKELGLVALAPREELVQIVKALCGVCVCVCVCLYSGSSIVDVVCLVSEVSPGKEIM